MAYKNIEIEKKGRVAVIRLICPEKLNPLTIETGTELERALVSVEKDENIRALIITGSGKSFSAGGDIKGMLHSIEEGSPDAYMDELTRALYSLALRIRVYPRPVIAAVNGYAVGAGMNLALSCDLIVASENAEFAQSFCKLGLIPGFGGTHLLINSMPWQKAAEISFFGNMISADEMFQLGFVNKIVPTGSLYDEAMNLAEKLAGGPTKAYERTKKLFLNAIGSGFDEHLDVERDVQVKSAMTDDYRAGVRALNKREKPDFKGR